MRKDGKSSMLIDNLDQINVIESNQREDVQNQNKESTVKYISINDILSQKKKKMETSYMCVSCFLPFQQHA